MQTWQRNRHRSLQEEEQAEDARGGSGDENNAIGNFIDNKDTDEDKEANAGWRCRFLKKTETLDPKAIEFTQRTAYGVKTWEIGHLNHWTYYYWSWFFIAVGVWLTAWSPPSKRFFSKWKEQIDYGEGWAPPFGECFPKKRRLRPEDDEAGFAEQAGAYDLDDGHRAVKGNGTIQSVVVIDKWGEKKVLDNDPNEEGYVP